MAEDDLELEEKKENEGEDAGAEATSKSKSAGKRKLILIGAAVAVVLSGAGIVLYQTMFSSSGAEASAEGEDADAEMEYEQDDLIATGAVVRLDTFLVNLADTDARRFARVRIEIVFPVASEASRVEESSVAMARAHDVALSLLSTKTADELGFEGRAALRDELRAGFRSALGGAEIADVLLTDLIVQ